MLRVYDENLVILVLFSAFKYIIEPFLVDPLWVVFPFCSLISCLSFHSNSLNLSLDNPFELLIRTKS